VTDVLVVTGLLTGVILIVGALTFSPVSLGPIVEPLSHGRFF
jgi:K+-transporting ATPase A subunit